MQTLNQPLSRRSVVRLSVAALVLALGGWGGVQLYSRLSGRPQSPEQVKRQIQKYLTKKTGRDSFATTIPEALAAADPSQAPKPQPRDNREGRRERNYRDRGPRPVEGMEEFRQRAGTAGDYRSIYGVIGEMLWVADQLEAKPDLRLRENGLLVAMDARHVAEANAVNPWLAARIAEAYFWPNLKLAETEGAKRTSADNLLTVAGDTFRDAGETNNVIRNFELVIANTKDTRTADMARFRISQIYENQGDYSRALHYVQQVQNTNNNYLGRRIASLQEKLRNK